jgi:ABC-type uncharacterized transport system substrate-binding protein
MDRRTCLGLIASCLLATSLIAEAQPAGKVWRLGLFHVGLDHVPPSLDGLRDGLKALGYEEGKNLQLDFRNVADEAAARAAAADLARARPDLLVAFASLNLRVKFHSLILRLASEHHLPVAGHRKEWVDRGALFSYAESIREVGRAAAARDVDKILKGARPADLPIEAYEHPELVINLKTAKALGLTIPPSLLQRADQVIE